MRAARARLTPAALVAAALGACSTTPPPAPRSERAALPATLALSEFHGCAIVRGGEVRCWGTDPLDEGRGALRGHHQWEPVVGAVVPGVSARDLGAGPRYGCAVLTTAEVGCWGRVDGDLFEPVHQPARVDRLPGLSDVVDLAVGRRHGCAATRDGRALCWGLNDAGQLGDGTQQRRDAPVDTTLTGVVAVAAAHEQSCALHGDGTVTCWGALTGDRTLTRKPFAVRWLTDAVEVAIGALPCVRHGDGKVECWSWRNLDGEVFSTPFEILGLERPTRLGLGQRHGCALEADGRVKCWKWPRDVSATPVPAYPADGVAGAVEVAVGERHTCARLGDDSVACWGDDGFGQLGDGVPQIRERPHPVDGLADIVELSSGPNRTCARRRDGAVICWGEKLVSTMPVIHAIEQGWSGTPAVALAERDIVELDTTDLGQCVRTGGRLACTHAPEFLEEVTDVRALALPSGRGLGCWIRTDGHVACAGSRGWSHCPGDNGCKIPRDIDGLAAIQQLALSEQRACGVDERGAVWCWGKPTSRTPVRYFDPPARLDGLGPVVGIAGGVAHFCAWSAAGELWCWGDNERGELGDGTTVGRDVPARVALAGPCAGVAAGRQFTCAALTDGRAQCWGAGDVGQLGDGTRADRLAPGPAVELADIAALSAGRVHACALTRAGAVSCWGRDSDGQLGQGREPARTVPVAVEGLD